MTVGSREESEAMIAKLQAGLARQDLLPPRSLRRNASDYPLVCYVSRARVTALGYGYCDVFLAQGSRPRQSRCPRELHGTSKNGS